MKETENRCSCLLFADCTWREVVSAVSMGDVLCGKSLLTMFSVNTWGATWVVLITIAQFALRKPCYYFSGSIRGKWKRFHHRNMPIIRLCTIFVSLDNILRFVWNQYLIPQRKDRWIRHAYCGIPNTLFWCEFCYRWLTLDFSSIWSFQCWVVLTIYFFEVCVGRRGRRKSQSYYRVC